MKNMEGILDTSLLFYMKRISIHLLHSKEAFFCVDIPNPERLIFGTRHNFPRLGVQVQTRYLIHVTYMYKQVLAF